MLRLKLVHANQWGTRNQCIQFHSKFTFIDKSHRKMILNVIFTIMYSWIYKFYQQPPTLTHWGRVTHIWTGKLTIIDSDNGLSPGWHQAIIWTNAGILLIGPLRTNFSKISIQIHIFSFKEMHLKMLSVKWRPFCLGLNVLTHWGLVMSICVRAHDQHWFRRWCNAYFALNYQQNQWWFLSRHLG